MDTSPETRQGARRPASDRTPAARTPASARPGATGGAVAADARPAAAAHAAAQRAADRSAPVGALARVQAMAEGRAGGPRGPGVVQGVFDPGLGDIDAIHAALKEEYAGVDVGTKWTLRRLAAADDAYATLPEVAAALGLSPKAAPAPAPAPVHADEVVLPAVGEARKEDAAHLGTVPAAVPSGRATAFDAARLATLVGALYDRTARPSREDILRALVAEYHPDHIVRIVESTDFVYAFQAVVRSRIRDAAFLDKTAVEDVAEDDLDVSGHPMGDISTWTLRHYSDKGDATHPPPFTEIKSALALGVAAPTADSGSKEKKSGHTGDVDWNRYGNVGNTFYLLYIDGHVIQKQKFLDNAKWYAEFPLADIPSLWVSSDWLDESAIKGRVLRGSGRAVHKALLAVGGRAPGAFFRSRLAAAFNNFEVKVPGSLPVRRWHKA